MNEPVHVILVRHGRTSWNAAGRIQGHTDIPLDDTGLWQAERLGAALASEPIDAIYSSDLRRARQTAEPLALKLGRGVSLLPALRERAFGDFEGSTFPELEASRPEDTQRWKQRDPTWGPPGGERLADFYARSVEALSALTASHAGQTVVVVTHGGVLDCLHRAALSLPLQAPRTWVLGNAAVNRLLRHAEGLTLLGWNDARHLEDQAADDTAA